jgi:hypothetical protein
MKRLLATVVLAAVTMEPALAQAQVQPPAKPQAPTPASAPPPSPAQPPAQQGWTPVPQGASSPLPPAKKRINTSPPTDTPTVKAYKESTNPDYRPERETIPQISIPLGKGSYRAGPAAGGIDDSVARCRAKRTSAEREACEAGLDGI